MNIATGFPETDSRAKAALDWLLRSQTATGGGGSAAYFSPVLGWSEPYPETTGYIIPTLFHGGDHFDEPAYGRAAEVMADWLVSLQAPEGWFPGGVLKKNAPRQPSIFNTGQILFGLQAAAQRTGDSRFLESACKAARWLIDQQEPSGRWIKHAYQAGYSPSYYAHVCWPLARLWEHTDDESIRQSVLQGLTAVVADRNENGTFGGWGFQPGRKAFTHTIAYTLQGVVESARILDAWDPLGKVAADSAMKLLRKYEVQHRLAGAYDDKWQGTYWYRCLTGHCQLASTWMRIYDETNDPRLLNAASKAVEEVCDRQRMNASRPDTHGAIGGSAPLIGAYMRLRYPNWAAKFFVDAILELNEKLGHLSLGIARPSGMAA